MSGAFGQQIKQADLDKTFLTGPGADLVPKLLMQLSGVKLADGRKPFEQLFGPYVAGSDKQRWADYNRFDWSIRQLPAINVFESETEDKQSPNSFLNGTVTIQVYWPANFRRSDLARIPVAFKGALQNFFEAKYAQSMLDEVYWHERPEKVFGLNQLGSQIIWTPNTEGLVENDMVPVTIVNVRYRIDLRAWYRALEFQNRTKDQPFEQTLADLTEISGQYDGVTDKQAQDIDVIIPDTIVVNSD